MVTVFTKILSSISQTLLQKHQIERDDLLVGDFIFKGTVKFRYLGCTVKYTNDSEDEIEIRAQNTFRCNAALHRIILSNLLS